MHVPDHPYRRQRRLCALFLGIVLEWPPLAVAQVPASASTTHAMVAAQERYELIDIDTLFFVDNRGLQRLLLDLNGHKFKLASDMDEVRRSANAFRIPEYGRITINIAAFLREGDGNYIEITPHGPPGTDAFIIIGDLLVPDEEVAYAITDLVDLPASFSMPAGYPNPFQERVRLTFDIPEAQIDGVDIHLAVYDARGRLIDVLIDDRWYPGRFQVDWKPGAAAANGVYFCRMIFDGVQETLNLVLVR